MKVRMKVQISGTRNGQEWPARGGTIDLPDEEAAHLIAQGAADEDGGAETTAEDEGADVETATAPDASEKRPARAARKGA